LARHFHGLKPEASTVAPLVAAPEPCGLSFPASFPLIVIVTPGNPGDGQRNRNRGSFRLATLGVRMTNVWWVSWATLVLRGAGGVEFGFGFADEFVGVGVFLGVFAGFVPELLAFL